jgi:nucleotide-binding universal stress UspA family protein
MIRRVLVGIDGSQGSRLALEWAVEHVTARGAVTDTVAVCRGAGEDRAEGYFAYLVSHRMAARVQVDQARQRLLGLVTEVAARVPAVTAPSPRSYWRWWRASAPRTAWVTL